MAHVLTRLMHPFTWQHMFVPALTVDTIPLLYVHQPYVMGCHSALLAKYLGKSSQAGVDFA